MNNVALEYVIISWQSGSRFYKLRPKRNDGDSSKQLACEPFRRIACNSSVSISNKRANLHTGHSLGE